MAGEYTARLYNELENEVIKDISRRVAKTGRFTETAEIQAKALRAQGYSPAKIQAQVMQELMADDAFMQDVAENTRAYKKEVKEIIKQTVAQAIEEGNELIANAGEMSWNDDLQVWEDHGVNLKKDKTLQQFQKAFKEQTAGELKNITRTTALKVNGVPVLDAYRHELDLAVTKVASGAFSFQQAMEDCCHRLGQGGVQVVYPSGKKYSIEAAARMTMRTGISQLAGKVTEANLQKTGTKYVFVTAHAGARPSHAEWHGKVYTYKGKPTDEYPDFYEATGYGTVEGLKGVNCTHQFYPHWEGDTIPEFHEPDPVTIDGKSYTFYEATQKQRAMERRVRNLSREKAAAEAAGDDEKAKELGKKIKETRKDYNTFSKDAGLRPKTERMRIYEDGINPGSKGAKDTPPTPAKAGAKISQGTPDAVKAASKNTSTKVTTATKAKALAKVEAKQEFTTGGTTYKVDGKHVLLDHKENEKAAAHLLSSEIKETVYLNPRVVYPQNISSPDFITESGRTFDLKEITGDGKNTIDTALKKKKQSDSYLLDISKTPMSIEKINEDIDRAFTHREYLREVYLIKDGKIIAKYERK